MDDPRTILNISCSDLYSFYKEFKADETTNYISQTAASKDETLLEALTGLANKLVALDLHIKTVLGDGPERRAWDSFTAGFAQFHLRCPRYRLNELVPELHGLT